MAKHNYDDSTAELAHDIVESAQQLVRLEISLAKQEVKELAITNGIAAASFAVAAVFLALGVLVALPVLIVAIVANHVLAALIWLVLYLVLAAGLGLFGKSRLRIQPPQRTITSLKETKSWALRQLSTNGKSPTSGARWSRRSSSCASAAATRFGGRGGRCCSRPGSVRASARPR